MRLPVPSVFALVLPLLGCAAPSDQHSRDLAACRRSAEHDMGPDSAIDPSDDHTGNPMVLARREDLRGQYQTMIDQCMGDNPH